MDSRRVSVLQRYEMQRGWTFDTTAQPRRASRLETRTKIHTIETLARVARTALKVSDA